jgi:two-component system, chemotaxis family, CheB/CheR fusion protein
LIEDGAAVEPNKIFIPPSDRDPIIEQGVFRLKKRPGRSSIHMPIDLFCKNLANEYNAMAGCIILSGTGTDGTQGVRLIKEKYGLVIAQDQSAYSYGHARKRDRHRPCGSGFKTFRYAGATDRVFQTSGKH